jgi:hypothetical protein
VRGPHALASSPRQSAGRAGRDGEGRHIVPVGSCPHARLAPSAHAADAVRARRAQPAVGIGHHAGEAIGDIDTRDAALDWIARAHVPPGLTRRLKRRVDVRRRWQVGRPLLTMTEYWPMDLSLERQTLAMAVVTAARQHARFTVLGPLKSE